MSGRTGSLRWRHVLPWTPVALLLAIEFALSSRSSLPEVLPAFIPYRDKFLHAGYFFLVGAFAARAARVGEGWSRGATAVAVLAGALLWGTADEWHQSFVPGRSVEAADALADVCGAGIAVLAVDRLLAARGFRA